MRMDGSHIRETANLREGMKSKRAGLKVKEALHSQGGAGVRLVRSGSQLDRLSSYAEGLGFNGKGDGNY